MKKVLFVCSGNTCRSPVAEGFFNHMAKIHGLNDVAASAGIAVLEEAPATREAVLAAAKYGVDITKHISRQLDMAALQEADEVYCMTTGHQSRLRAAAPSRASRIMTIDITDIPDPYMGSQKKYDEAAAAIWLAVGRLVDNRKEYSNG